jgi:hypothetical protein
MKTLLTILLSLSLTCQAQDIKYASINILSSSIIAGVGSGIHKDKGETFFHAFKNGLWKGAIGGAVQFTSKKVAAQIYYRQNYWFGLGSRVVNSVGNSIIYSACLNQNITANYMFDFGFIHYQTDFKGQRVELNPCNLGVFVYTFFDKQNEFNMIKTLQTGVLFFDKKIDLSKMVEGKNISFGNTVCNVMRVQKYNIAGFTEGTSFDKYQTAGHELIHTLQYEDNINIITLGKTEKIKYITWDVPFWNAMYATANLKGYNQNYYEQESKWLSSKL